MISRSINLKGAATGLTVAFWLALFFSFATFFGALCAMLAAGVIR